MCDVNTIFSASLCNSNPTGTKLPKRLACRVKIKEMLCCLCMFQLQNTNMLRKLPCFYWFTQELERSSSIFWAFILPPCIFFVTLPYFSLSFLSSCQWRHVANFIIWLVGSGTHWPMSNWHFLHSVSFPRRLPAWFEWAGRLISSDILYFSRVLETDVQLEWINYALRARSFLIQSTNQKTFVCVCFAIIVLKHMHHYE